MPTIPGDVISELVYENGLYALYGGTSEQDRQGKTLLCKAFKGSRFDPQEVTRLKQEYQTVRQMESKTLKG
jgi:hypothetical protein